MISSSEKRVGAFNHVASLFGLPSKSNGLTFADTGSEEGTQTVLGKAGWTKTHCCPGLMVLQCHLTPMKRSTIQSTSQLAGANCLLDPWSVGYIFPGKHRYGG